MKILFATHSPARPTGYGRVAAVLADALAAARHDVVVLGLGHPPGDQARRAYRVRPWASLEDVRALEAAVDEESPRLLITCGDPWMFPTVHDLRTRRPALRWLAYFPVDGYPLPSEWRPWVEAVDAPVVFCDFSRRVVHEGTGRSPSIVPHGVCTTTFAPGDKEAAKRRVGVAGHFVVGTVAANQQRKNLPALVKAFAAFAADKPDALLYLHTDVVGGFWDVQELINRFGLDARTRVTLNISPQRGAGVSDAVLSTIYNAMDVFVLPTMAEGFGLPILESQACGVPALATDFSSCPDLLPDPFCRLRVKATLVMARNAEQAVVDEADIAAKLDHLYRHPQERANRATTARQFAMNFEWRLMAARFVHAVEDAALLAKT